MSENHPHWPALWRGALSRALDEGLAGEALDFHAVPEQANTPTTPPSIGQVSSQASSAAPPKDHVPVWRIESVERGLDADAPTRPPTRSDIAPLGPTDIGRPARGRTPPPWSPLTPWPRLRRVLEGVWSRASSQGAVDLRVVVSELSRARPLRRLPRQPRRAGGARVIVALDLSERLTPLLRDQLDLLDHLRRHLGYDIDTAVVVREARDIASLGDHLGLGDTLLVLGDLGLHATPELRRDWQQLGDALHHQGIRPLALLACPAHRWTDAALVRRWSAIDWTQPDTPTRPRVHPHADATSRLLALLSWIVRLEPALVRAIRLRLGDQADLATELDVWNLPGTKRHPAGLMLSPELRLAGQRDLLSLMHGAAPLLHDVIALVRRHHESLPREVWLEEARMLELLDPGRDWISAEEREQVEAFTHRVLARLRTPSGEGVPLDALRSWAGRVHRTRVPERGWSHPRLGHALVEIGDALGLSHELVPGQRAAHVLGVLDDAPEAVWEVRQRGERFVIARPGGETRGSELYRMRAGGKIGVGGVVRELPLDIPMPKVERLRIESRSGEAVTLRFDVGFGIVPLPEWASAGGRDRYGVWAAFRVGEVEQRMRWIPPGTFTMGSPDTEIGRYDDEGPQHEVTFTQGFWLAATPCTQALWVAVMGSNPSRFQSPQRPVELVSWNDAQQFITALRERVPGLDADLPSEARWEYACRAGTTTATYAGDLDLRGDRNAPVLDAIAWYGGNSGHHAFDLGDQGYDSSDWPEKQYPHRRAATREVATRRANPWGLHDMLGNVWEWCADMFGRYEAAAVDDPPPRELGQWRVYRGGSWGDPARDVRAAYRFWFGPGLRYVNLGFRLAGGQGLRQEPARNQSGNQSPDRAKQGQEQGTRSGPATPGVARKRSSSK